MATRTSTQTSTRASRATDGAGHERLARALGWFSVGLGLAEVVAPRRVARLIGVNDDGGNVTVLRTMGMRELTSGVGILMRPRPTGWVWSRVAGDAIDLALLSSALRSDNTERTRTVAATAAVVGVTALDVLAGTRLTRRPGSGVEARSHAKDNTIRLTTAVTVNRPPEEIYQYWHDFQNLPQFMDHLESVRITGEGRSHWKAKAPAGMTVEWDAEIVEDRPNELIVWRSLPGADVDNTGTVRFRRAPGKRGTEIVLTVHYSPPGGVIGAKLAKLFNQVPKTQMGNDLRHFKQVIETGEVVRSMNH